MSGTDDEYKVGYGRPPKHTRFKPGRSGNISGSKASSKQSPVDVDAVLEAPINVREKGKARSMSPREIGLHKKLKDALAGNLKALTYLLDRFNA